jgi:hypothetical protein
MQRHDDLTQTMRILTISERISGLFLKRMPEYGFLKITLNLVGAGIRSGEKMLPPQV